MDARVRYDTRRGQSHCRIRQLDTGTLADYEQCQQKKITFPQYNPAAIGNIRIPNIFDDRTRGILTDCWELTKDTVVPQFRDGECEVRRLWDEAVAEAMGWDADELTRLRHLLHREPHVRGLGYNQYADEVEDEVE